MLRPRCWPHQTRRGLLVAAFPTKAAGSAIPCGLVFVGAQSEHRIRKASCACAVKSELKPDVCIRLTNEQRTIEDARKQARLTKPFNVEQRIQAMFIARDKNHDGFLTPNERGFLWREGANGDGRVELTELWPLRRRWLPLLVVAGRRRGTSEAD